MFAFEFLQCFVHRQDVGVGKPVLEFWNIGRQRFLALVVALQRPAAARLVDEDVAHRVDRGSVGAVLVAARGHVALHHVDRVIRQGPAVHAGARPVPVGALGNHLTPLLERLQDEGEIEFRAGRRLDADLDVVEVDEYRELQPFFQRSSSSTSSLFFLRPHSAVAIAARGAARWHASKAPALKHGSGEGASRPGRGAWGAPPARVGWRRGEGPGSPGPRQRPSSRTVRLRPAAARRQASSTSSVPSAVTMRSLSSSSGNPERIESACARARSSRRSASDA